MDLKQKVITYSPLNQNELTPKLTTKEIKKGEENPKVKLDYLSELTGSDKIVWI